MMIARQEFLNELRKQVSEAEREGLEHPESGARLLIGESNRATMLRLLNDDAQHDGEVDAEDALRLRTALAAYLDTYMANQPSGHKWIILCCLYLAMVTEEPLHPQSAAGWQEREDGYYCGSREDHDGSICRWCVCRRLEG